MTGYCPECLCGKCAVERHLRKTSRDATSLCQWAIEEYGVDAQMEIAIEECAELMVAICHRRRGRAGSDAELAGEIADVGIMLEQLTLIAGVGPDVARIRGEKLERLRARLEAE